MALKEKWHEIVREWAPPVSPFKKPANYLRHIKFRENNSESGELEKRLIFGKAAIGVTARIADRLAHQTIDRIVEKGEKVNWDDVESWSLHPEGILDFCRKSHDELRERGYKFGFFSLHPGALREGSKMLAGTITTVAQDIYNKYSTQEGPQEP